MKIKLNKNILEKGMLQANELVEFLLQNTDLHFKIKDLNGELTRENVYNQLSLNKLYNDKDENIKKAYIKNDFLVLEF